MTIDEYARAVGTSENERARGKQFTGEEPLVQRLLYSIQYNIRTGCWLWIGNLRPNGYGRMWYRGKSLSAHRTSYEYFVGPIPEGLELDHLCRVPRCINPAHLEPVTQQENWLRSHALTRKNRDLTECPKGHPYEGHNLVVRERDGARVCRRCRNDRAIAYSRRRRLREVANG